MEESERPLGGGKILGSPQADKIRRGKHGDGEPQYFENCRQV